MITVSPNTQILIEFNETVIQPELWSAETPNLNALLIALQSNGGPVQVIYQIVGFKSAQLKNGQILVNGKRVLIKIGNRHEHHPVPAVKSSQLDAIVSPLPNSPSDVTSDPVYIAFTGILFAIIELLC